MEVVTPRTLDEALRLRSELPDALPTQGGAELIVAVRVRGGVHAQTFMKVGPRNAMVIAVVSLALGVDRERGTLSAAFGSAGPVATLVTAALDDADSFAERVAAAASPIDDVR